ncbi:MAG: hypothetical protein PGN16_11095 [Sphingomonas phyllosphaerae]|uniref:hypothetical protein n=1 Tax=Sphingomonas phyllosphaerae TaxID=257003 RepID=UPI002FF88FA6
MKPAKIIMAGVALLSVNVVQAQERQNAAECELHIWPSLEIDGVHMGALGLFGAIGAAADASGRKSERASIADLMLQGLPADAQIEELERADVASALGLTGYRIIAEPAVPSKASAKADPALRQRREAIRAGLKTRNRLTSSAAPCYAELIGDRIFYVKTPLVSGTLNAGWTFRDFGRAASAKPSISSGEVKNSLKAFPPKTPDDLAAAQADLRAAYRADFAEWVTKKLRRSGVIEASTSR